MIAPESSNIKMTANRNSSSGDGGFTTLRLLEEMRNDARQAEHMIDDQIAQLEELCNINETDIISSSTRSNQALVSPTPPPLQTSSPSFMSSTRVNEMNNKNNVNNNYMNATLDDHAISNTQSPRPMSSGLHERSSSNNHNNHNNKQTNVFHAKQTVASLLQSFSNTLSECKKSVHRFEALIQSMNDLHTQLQNQQEANLLNSGSSSNSNNYHNTTTTTKRDNSVISKADLAASATHIERLHGIASTMWNEIHKLEKKFNLQMNRLRSIQRLQREFDGNGADSASAADKDGKGITEGDLYRDDNLRMLLAEQSSLRHTSNRLNNILAEAYGTHDTLRRQREQFEAIQNKLTAIAERVPLINSVLKRIHSRRRRNAVVLGCVIALCVFVIYLFL